MGEYKKEQFNNGFLISPSPEEVLLYLADNGIIDLDDVCKQTHEMNLEKAIMPNQPYQLWQGTDGRWNCYVVDDTRPMGRRRISSSSKKKLLEKIVMSSPEKYEYVLTVPTLREIYPKWIEYKKSFVEETTIPRIHNDWKKYYERDVIVDIPISQLNKVYLETWLSSLIKDYAMTKTNYYNVSSIIRQLFEYAFEEELIRDNPMLRVKKKLYRKCRMVMKAADDSQVYTDDEVHMLESLVINKMKEPGKRVYELAPLAILFQLYTGMRVSEICALKYSDIDIEGEAHISRMLVRDSKTVRDGSKHRKTRSIHLARTALDIVEYTVKYKGNSEGYIFSMTDEPFPERVVNDYLKRYCKELGIPYRSSHKLRKTAISSMVDSGMSINAVKTYAGHSSEETTLSHYVFDRNGKKTRNRQVDLALSYQ